MRKIRVRAKRKKFWRAGIQFTDAWMELDADELDDEGRLKTIQEEPMLQVEFIEDEGQPSAEAASKKAK